MPAHRPRNHPSRRALFTIGAAGAGSVVLAHPAAAALPVVTMELVVLAAQLDPVKSGTGITAGAGPSVLEVERALVAKGMLSSAYVDGHFGTATKAAYVRWQKSLGFTGLDANGLPGNTSLSALGSGRFTLTRTVSLGGRTSYQGYPFNVRTVTMLLEAQRLSGVGFAVEQGSYSPGFDPNSAGTHDGGGAVDIDARPLTSAQRLALVTAMRRVGFAAWLRTPAQADWTLHIHGVAANDLDLHPTAQNQVGKYYLGLNGLANNAPDDGPKVTKVTWEQYLRARPAR